MTLPALGAPGIYRLPDERIRALTGVRMDVCAFVGVAPRGPARVPTFRAPWAQAPCGPSTAGMPASVRSVVVTVESFEAYLRIFGGFEGPGLLPYAVAAYFENGGRRAQVVRIVHAYGDVRDEEGVAIGEVAGLRDVDGDPLRLRARSEGAWGNRLRAHVTFDAIPLVFESASTTELRLAPDSPVMTGSLLRLTLDGSERVLRFVASVHDEWRAETGLQVRRALLAAPTAAAAEAAEIVEAELAVDDRDGREELHERLGLAPEHPRWIAAVLYRESGLVYPDPDWIDDAVTVEDPTLAPPAPPHDAQFEGGLDRYADITPEDFFDSEWVTGNECPGSGVHALVELSDLSLLVVPDLYSPAPLVPVEEVTDPLPLAGATFDDCVVVPPTPAASVPVPELEGLRRDPEIPAELEAIIGYQTRLVALADTLRSFIVLLDVPPRDRKSVV